MIYLQKRMFRLIQGDVGSGKTIVSLAALNTIKSDIKRLMVPTEILAKQHFIFQKIFLIQISK